MDAATQQVTLEVQARVARLRLARVEKRNALTLAMWSRVGELAAAAVAQGARILLLEGAPGAFSAGADIEELAQQLHEPAALRAGNAVVQATQLSLERLPIPTIAAIDGPCVGGGLGLALACDLRIASARSRFAITPARLGLTYSVADTRRLVQAVGVPCAREMLYTGRPLDAAQALARGLVSQVVADDALAAAVQELVTELLANSGSACAAIKRTIAHVAGDPATDLATAQALFDAAFASADFAEGAAAFLARRPPRF